MQNLLNIVLKITEHSVLSDLKFGKNNLVNKFILFYGIRLNNWGFPKFMKS